MKFNKVSWWNLWIGDPRNFHNSFFVKNYYLNLNYFKHCIVFFLKTKQKILSRKVQVNWKLLGSWHSKREKQNIKKRERKTKNMKKSNNRFFTFTFLYRKIYILSENIYLENLVCIVKFALPFFHVAGYWKRSNTNAHTDIHWLRRRHTSIQNT